jgi:hypothetical protein
VLKDAAARPSLARFAPTGRRMAGPPTALRDRVMPARCWRSREWLRRQVAVEMMVAVIATAAAVIFGSRDNDVASVYLGVIAFAALALVAIFSRMSNNSP